MQVIVKSCPTTHIFINHQSKGDKQLDLLDQLSDETWDRYAQTIAIEDILEEYYPTTNKETMHDNV